MYKCKICNKEFEKMSKLHSHIAAKEKIKILDYYIQFENFKIPKCKFCNENAKYLRSLIFYQTCCNKECISKNNKSKKHSVQTKNKISDSLKSAIQSGRAKGWNNSRNKQKISYPEEFFIKIIQNEIEDKNYIKEYQIGIYSIDFAWPLKKLAIEIDGKQHDWEERKLSDKNKDKLLKESGWQVLRIKWKDMYNNPKQYIEIVKDFIDNIIDYEKYYNLIFNSYSNELDFEYLFNTLQLEYKIDTINRKYIYDKKEIEEKINLILNSNIDFSKFGWVQKVSEILKISPQKVGKWMKRNMLEFYNTKCFKKKEK